ncbi:MAG TPA: SCO family protein [Parafilimonas sp.]|nr:SCO family protein [Parafilimonas sp.]
MISKKNKPVTPVINKLFFGIIVTGLLAFIVVFVFSSSSPSKKSLPVLGGEGHMIESFSFTDQDGKTITDKDVAGKIRVAEYFFTTCKSICPIMNGNLQAVQNAYKDRNDVIILSHTVDPEDDSVGALKSYAKLMHAIPGKWEFLTGDKLALYQMAEKDYLLSADTTTSQNKDSAFIHTQYVTLVDKQNRIRGFYDATSKQDINKLISDIKQLL